MTVSDIGCSVVERRGIAYRKRDGKTSTAEETAGKARGDCGQWRAFGAGNAAALIHRRPARRTRRSIVNEEEKATAANSQDILTGIIWKAPERFAELPITAFYFKSGSPKAAIALWNVWHEDKDYRRERKRWRALEAAADDLKKEEDRQWRRWTKEPDSKEKFEGLCRVNESAEKRCKVVNDFLETFAERFGIPPINPKSRNIEQEARQAIRRWNVGKFNRAAWEISNDFEDEMAHRFRGLRIYVKGGAATGDIQTGEEAVVEEWSERNKVKPARKVTANEEKYDAYAKAWYLGNIKGWTPSQIAHELFGRGGKNYTKEAKRYAAAGFQLYKGRPHFIRGKKTLRPEHEEKFKASMSAWLKRHRRVGGSKVKT